MWGQKGPRPGRPLRCSPQRCASSRSWAEWGAPWRHGWPGWRCCGAAPHVCAAQTESLFCCHCPQRCCAHHPQNHSQSQYPWLGLWSWKGSPYCCVLERTGSHGCSVETINNKEGYKNRWTELSVLENMSQDSSFHKAGLPKKRHWMGVIKGLYGNCWWHSGTFFWVQLFYFAFPVSFSSSELWFSVILIFTEILCLSGKIIFVPISQKNKQIWGLFVQGHTSGWWEIGGQNLSPLLRSSRSLDQRSDIGATDPQGWPPGSVCSLLFNFMGNSA